jgi:hypothetical protein
MSGKVRKSDRGHSVTFTNADPDGQVGAPSSEFLRRWAGKISEALAHRLGDVRRPASGPADDG